jgi:hypothetical protein
MANAKEMRAILDIRDDLSQSAWGFGLEPWLERRMPPHVADRTPRMNNGHDVNCYYIRVKSGLGGCEI